MAKKAAKSAVKKSAAEARPASLSAPNTVSFGPAKKELASLKGKLQAIINKEGENLTIQDIILKIEALDKLLICQTIMTREF